SSRRCVPPASQPSRPLKYAKQIYQGAGGQWFLTTAEKKRILLKNIYGVDIDPQAVEVTKLNLLLCALENENQTTLGQLNLIHERALPDLSSNIKCGNSLIGPDFYDGQQMSLFDEDARYKINAFDWPAEFPEIFKGKNPGFDAVIGNPPYVRPHNLSSRDKEYFWQHYATFVKKSDLYCCFIEKGLRLLKKDGKFGYIVSSGWLRLDSFQELRKLLLSATSIDEIIEFTGYVFKKAAVKTGILLFSKSPEKENIIRVAQPEPEANLTELAFRPISQSLFNDTYKCIFDTSIREDFEVIKRKMRESGVSLGEIFQVAFGLKTGDDSKFLTNSCTTPEHKALLRGEDVHRYSYRFKGEYVWYVPETMRAHRTTARPGSKERFEQPKVLIRDTGGSLEGTFDKENYYVKDVLVVFDENHDVKRLAYLIGLLNSKLMRFYYETSFPTLHVQRNELAVLPIRMLDLTNIEHKTRHDRIISLVESMLDLHKQLSAARAEHDKTLIQRQISATDEQIDKLVYELYGLTEEEIEIVEESAIAK
ncbi:MAG: N-6 DNA methylase, partial [Phycisphaerae bacterium]|nr:N-6 DNA methylase [Phycisphaerae bacterium]